MVTPDKETPHFIENRPKKGVLGCSLICHFWELSKNGNLIQTLLKLVIYIFYMYLWLKWSVVFWRNSELRLAEAWGHEYQICSPFLKKIPYLEWLVCNFSHATSSWSSALNLLNDVLSKILSMHSINMNILWYQAKAPCTSRFHRDKSRDEALFIFDVDTLLLSNIFVKI